MKTRSAELREKHRRILAWSLSIAVVIHVAIFALSPSIRVAPIVDLEHQLEEAGRGEGAPMYVDVVFGPPGIFEPDGTLSDDAPERELHTDRLIEVPTECAELSERGNARAIGSVRLRVRESGEADVVRVAESTGNDCGDRVITAVAGALKYHWLPSERFPPPVELVQPLTLTYAWE